MSFPTSPVNGQTATVAGISYIYDSTKGTWTKVGAAIGGSSIVNGNSSVNIAANSNVTVSVAGNANVLTVTGTGANVSGTANVTGNLYVGNILTNGYYFANGSAFSVDTSQILNGNSNVKVAANSNVTVSVAGTANVMVIANDSFFVSTVRNDTSNIGNIVTYNPISKEITYSNQLTVMQTQLYLNSIYF